MPSVFSIHYFLWYGALTSIFGYESVYARYYTNSTPLQYGYLNMLLPFMTVISTPVICSLADRRRTHRSYFTISLLVSAIALMLYSLLPILMSDEFYRTRLREGEVRSTITRDTDSVKKSGGLLTWPWIYYCCLSLLCDLAIGVNTCLSDSFAVLQAEEEATSFGRIIVWGTFGWASTALVLSLISQTDTLPRLLPGLLFGSCLLTIDVMIMSFWPHPSDFRLDLIPLEAAHTLTGSSSSLRKEPIDYQPSNESAHVSLGSSQTDGKGGNEPLDNGEQLHRIVIHSSPSQSNSGRRTISPIELAYQAQTRSSNTVVTINGNQECAIRRPINMSETHSTISGLLATPLHSHKADLKNESLTKTDANVPKPSAGNQTQWATSFAMQLTLIGLILCRRKTLIRFLILFILSGFFMSMHWNYFFLYLDQIHHDRFRLISALSMVGQSMLGELPFFILSRKLIDHCGRSHALSISIISIGLRFLLYRFVLPYYGYYVIPFADCFQGPNYGLFYVVMTEVGLEYSYCDQQTIDTLAARGHFDPNSSRQVAAVRLSLRSTVQSVAFACYEGLGVGIGSVVGGWMVAKFGFETLWLSMATASISVGVLNSLIELSCREHDPEDDEIIVSQKYQEPDTAGGSTHKELISFT